MMMKKTLVFPRMTRLPRRRHAAPAGRLRLLRPLSRWWRRAAAVTVVLLVAAVAVAAVRRSADPTHHFVAYFERTVGLYRGSDIRVLGVKVGEVTAITPSGGHVRVDAEYSTRFKIPADAEAVLIPPSIVSDRYVQLSPAYTGGPALSEDAEIPLSRTGAPLETDEVYRALSDLTGALGPEGANASGAFSDLVRTARENLEGSGDDLGATIDGLSKVASAFADGKDDVFATLVNLQKFTTLLAQSDRQVKTLNDRFAEIAARLGEDKDELASMLHHLAGALTEIAGFVKDNRAGLADNVTALADVTGILVRQQQALAQFMTLAPLGLNNLLLAYNPQTGNLDFRNCQITAVNPGCDRPVTPTSAGTASGAAVPAGLASDAHGPATQMCVLLMEDSPDAVPPECAELARTLQAQGQPLPPQFTTLPGRLEPPGLPEMFDLLLGGGAATIDVTTAGILPRRR
jgi:phospholipid/cholesterol/gamma-HCH transport system substrate-binding protein